MVKTISWKSIEHLFLLETTTDTPGVRMCHKLTRDHVWLTSIPGSPCQFTIPVQSIIITEQLTGYKHYISNFPLQAEGKQVNYDALL